MFKPITVEDCDFTRVIEPEGMSVRGNLQVSDDPRADREAENAILRRLEDGDEWAWCRVIVRAEFCGFFAQVSLGGCSYESESAFLKSDDYRDMREECVGEINEYLAKLYEKIHQP